MFFSACSLSTFAQIRIKDFSRIETLFQVTQLETKCDGWGDKCFYRLATKQAKKDRPAWLKGLGDRFYAIRLSNPAAYKNVRGIGLSEVVSITRNTGFILEEPVMEFKIEKDSTLFLIYKKGKEPKAPK